MRLEPNGVSRLGSTESRCWYPLSTASTQITVEGSSRLGSLHYADRSFTFDDRVLTHLQSVFSTKLRRREGFMMTWNDRAGTHESTRQTIWIDPAIPLRFHYDAPQPGHLRRSWIDQLIESANSASGLQLEDDLRAEIREELPIGSSRQNRENRHRPIH